MIRRIHEHEATDTNSEIFRHIHPINVNKFEILKKTDKHVIAEALFIKYFREKHKLLNRQVDDFTCLNLFN